MDERIMYFRKLMLWIYNGNRKDKGMLLIKIFLVGNLDELNYVRRQALPRPHMTKVSNTFGNWFTAWMVQPLLWQFIFISELLWWSFDLCLTHFFRDALKWTQMGSTGTHSRVALVTSTQPSGVCPYHTKDNSCETNPNVPIICSLSGITVFPKIWIEFQLEIFLT